MEFLQGNAILEILLLEEGAFMDGVEALHGIGIFDDIPDSHILQVEDNCFGSVVKMAFHPRLALENLDRLPGKMVDDLPVPVDAHRVKSGGLVAGIVGQVDVAHVLDTVAVDDPVCGMKVQLLGGNVGLKVEEQKMKTADEGGRVDTRVRRQRLDLYPVRSRPPVRFP